MCSLAILTELTPHRHCSCVNKRAQLWTLGYQVGEVRPSEASWDAYASMCKMTPTSLVPMANEFSEL